MMPGDEPQLRALRETMVAVNHVVLNRLVIIRMIIDEVRSGRALTERHIELMDQAVSETVEHLRALSEVAKYESHEIIGGVHAVKYSLGADDGEDDGA